MPLLPISTLSSDRFSAVFSAFLARRVDRLSRRVDRFTFWRQPQVGYTFAINTDAVGLRLCHRLFSAYTGRFNSRFTRCRIEDVPELALALEHLPRTEIHNFTMFVIGQLSQERDRFDFDFYEVVSDLLRQLLERRPYANETDILRMGEALFFLSPNGYDGILYWPLSAYLRSVRASYGGRRPAESLCEILEVMTAELSDHFTFGYAAEARCCQALITELLEGNTAPIRTLPPSGDLAGAEELYASYQELEFGE
ncbi:hypothetical protein FUA23_16140 [Neolewinella aurantiaca]|uniref:Uncharacterized protein n=1 Tax=Neolewinella aurantiaca TaxID=2602767 RepID=A0A5C7FQ97_9BACT|nr:hypothetical protein [Neolewinella aurantiaca]TXF88170.1 hypothetical protein FUA23_16140 [Neolewinella aurantiaca]